MGLVQGAEMDVHKFRTLGCVSMTKRRVISRKTRAVGVVAMTSFGILAFVVGCGTTASTVVTKSRSSTPQAPTAGGTIIDAQSPQTNYNWYIPITNASFDYNAGLYDEIYKPLLWINNNYSINWKSSVADKITYNSSGTVYHVFLNPKWKWSNGQPVTSKDVLFTWDVIKAASAANAPAPWPYVGAGTGDIPNGVRSVKKNGKYELTVTLKKPANQQWFIYNGLIQLVPLPSSVWDIHKNIDKEIKYLGSEATNPKFVSVVDGPFKLSKVVQNQYWTLVPNENYSGHKSIVHKIIFAYEASNSSEFSALKSNTVNVGFLDLSQYGSRSSLLSQGDVITPMYTFGYLDTELNMFPGSPVRKIFDKLYVRQAMQMGTDSQAINQSIYHGYAPPIDGPIPTVPETQFYDSALSKNPYPFNIEKGKKLLEAHGWKLVDGVMTKGNQKLKFTMLFPSGTQSESDTAVVMKQDWAKEGIDVTLKPMPFSTLISVTSNTKDPSAWQIATGLGWDYDGPGFYPSGGGLFGTGAPSGDGYSNSEEDSLIQATHEPYPTRQKNMSVFYQYELYTAKHLPVLWLNNTATLSVHAPNVHGTVKYADASPGIPQMQYWWVSPTK